MSRLAIPLALIALVLPTVASAQTLAAFAERRVIHAPLDAGAELRVRSVVGALAANFGLFYPQARYRNVRAVYFESGAVIVCGELNKAGEAGLPSGWRYFSNSGPLIFESDKQEVLCDRRTYPAPAFSDDHEYAAEFASAAAQ